MAKNIRRWGTSWGHWSGPVPSSNRKLHSEMFKNSNPCSNSNPWVTISSDMLCESPPTHCTMQSWSSETTKPCGNLMIWNGYCQEEVFALEGKQVVIVLEASWTSVQAVARKYNVDRQNTCQWKHNLDRLEKTVCEKREGVKWRGLVGGGRKPLAQAVEEELYEWYKEA